MKTSQTQSWEEEFDEKFFDRRNHCYDKDGILIKNPSKKNNDIKAFISQHFINRNELVEWLGEQKKVPNEYTVNDPYHSAHNSALTLVEEYVKDKNVL